MPDSKSISELTTAENTTSNDLFETAMANGQLGYLSRKVTLEEIADFIASEQQYSSALQTTAKTITGAINEAAQSGGGYTDLTGTLTAGNTTITFTDNALIATCTLDIYVDDAFFGVVPTALSTDYSNNSITLTFPAQASNMGVKVRIS